MKKWYEVTQTPKAKNQYLNTAPAYCGSKRTVVATLTQFAVHGVAQTAREVKDVLSHESIIVVDFIQPWPV